MSPALRAKKAILPDCFATWSAGEITAPLTSVDLESGRVETRLLLENLQAGEMPVWAGGVTATHGMQVLE